MTSVREGHKEGHPESKGLSSTCWGDPYNILPFIERKRNLNLPPTCDPPKLVLHEAPDFCNVPFRRGAAIWSVIGRR